MTLAQAREAYARDELSLDELEREVEFILGLRQRPVVPTNYVQITRALFYGEAS